MQESLLLVIAIGLLSTVRTETSSGIASTDNDLGRWQLLNTGHAFGGIGSRRARAKHHWVLLTNKGVPKDKPKRTFKSRLDPARMLQSRQFLEQTILSVLCQDYPNIEYIIINGGSTDSSTDIIRKYQDKLVYWVSEKDRGQAHAINKGFAKARGSLMNWLCSDDILEPSMVSISVHYLQKYTNVGLNYGDRIRKDAKGNIYSLQCYPAFRPYFLRWGFTLPQETVLFRREVLEAVGMIDESLLVLPIRNT